MTAVFGFLPHIVAAPYATVGNGVNLDVTGTTISGFSNSAGGAIVVQTGGTVSGSNFLFANNTATGVGGAITTAANSYVILESGTFRGNSAGSSSGAVSVTTGATFRGKNLLFVSNSSANYSAVANTGTLILSDCLFVSNTAKNAAAIQAGAGFNSGTNLTFEKNYATDFGGAIYIGKNTTFTLHSSTLQENRGNYGGGIVIEGTLVGSNMVFTSNTSYGTHAARHGGAILIRQLGDAYITDSVFESNYSNRNGGAVQILQNFSGTNLIFTSNTAVLTGGAISVAVETTGSGALNLAVSGTNLTYEGNTAKSGTGGFLFMAANVYATNINIAANSKLTIGASGNGSATDSIASADATAVINKTGEGTLVLNADDSANWKGRINLTKGALLLGNDNAKLGGTLAIASGATFGGSGTVAVAGAPGTALVTATSGVTLQVGLGDHAAKKLAIDGTLVLSDATVNFLAFNGTHATQLAANTITATGGNTLNLQSFVSGTYLLGDIATQLAGASLSLNGSVTVAGGRQGVERDTSIGTASELWVRVWTSIARVMNWTGENGTEWSYGADNWGAQTDSTVKRFAAGDTVVFNSAADSTVAVAVNVAVTGMTVGGGATTTFNGPGGITGHAYQSGDAEAAVMAGTGKLTKNDSGTLIFNNGANIFEGGIEINGGTIEFARADQIKTGASAITFAGSGTLRTTGSSQFENAIVINGGKTGAIDATAGGVLIQGAGAISGSGTLVKTGAGALVLTRANSHAATELRAGTLGIAHADALGQGPLAVTGNNVTLGVAGGLNLATAINAGANNMSIRHGGGAAITIAGAINGTGVLTAAGSGTLRFTGANTLGGFAVGSGATILAAHAGALGGAGSAVTVDANGSLVLGEVAGVLARSVDVNGGRLVFDSLASGQPLLRISSTMTLRNNAVIVLGDRIRSASYTLAEAGAFSGAEGADFTIDAGPNTDYTIRLGYDDALHLVVVGKEINPSKDIVATFNAMGASINAVYSHVSESFLVPLTERLDEGIPASVWIKAIGSFARYDGDAKKIGFDERTQGILIGYDHIVSEKYFAGAYFSYTDSFITTANSAETHSDLPSGGVYGAVRLGPVHIAADATIGALRATTSRHDAADHADGSYDAVVMGASLEAGMIAASWRNGCLKPAAALHYMRMNFRNHLEDGTGAIFLDNFAAERLQSFLSAQVTQNFTTRGGRHGMFDFTAGWRYNLQDDVPEIGAFYAKDMDTRFTIQGDKYARSAFVAGLGVRLSLTRAASFGLSYDYELASDYDRHTVSGVIRWTW